MFRGRGRGRGGGHASPIKVPLKGFFDKVWKCNCQPRLPAGHFQTKNGGKNHGRWFYTCQQPQPKRCNFFLWDDEAKPREEAAILNNSRSEPRSPPATPSRAGGGLAHSPNYALTPVKGRSPSRTASPSPMPATSTAHCDGSAIRTRILIDDDEGEEFFEWPLSDDQELRLSEAADRASTNDGSRSTEALPPIETPCKAAKTAIYTSPGKRRRSQTEDRDAGSLPTPSTEDPFVTPLSTVPRKNHFLDRLEPKTPTPSGNGRNLMSPSPTPTLDRYRDVLVGIEEDPGLTADVFNLLDSSAVYLNKDVQDALQQVLGRHVLQAQGVARGRDISRLTLKTKDARISELQNRIASLESERETDKAVIRHLRQKAQK
ncbi:MAG: hypothetical protein M1812_001650 [Candelaria pacifica]|nr:MAG: hypothetical protein M1812_001650 [Candelaria pacifica]